MSPNSIKPFHLDPNLTFWKYTILKDNYVSKQGTIILAKIYREYFDEIVVQVTVIQWNLDISNLDISNSVKFEASNWNKNNILIGFSNNNLALGTFYKFKLPEVQINLHFG